jgi:hypothetical protein
MNCPNHDPECKNRLVKSPGQSKADQLFSTSVAGESFFCDTWHSLFHGQEKEKKRRGKKNGKEKENIPAKVL